MLMRSDWILFAVLALFITISNGARTKRMYAMCPPQFEKIGQECYYISNEKLNWLEAHFACKDKNSKLAEPYKFEDRALRKYLIQNDNDRTLKWIGGVYNWEKHQWQWGQTGKNLTYQSFSQMDPRSSLDLRYHCSVLNPSQKYRWSARICTEKQYFVCQHRMPYVNEFNRQKIYNKWNETYPNEMANEIEVMMDEGVGNVKRPGARRLHRLPKQQTIAYKANNEIASNDVLEIPVRNVTRRRYPKRRYPKDPNRPRKHNKKHPTPYPEILNDAAIVGVKTGEVGDPIIEYAPHDFDFIQTNTLSPEDRPTKPPHRTHRPRRPKKKPVKPIIKQTNNVMYSISDYDSEKPKSREYQSKPNTGRSNYNNDEEEKRMAEARELILTNRREREEKQKAEERRNRYEEARKKRLETQRRLAEEKEQQQKMLEEIRRQEEQRKIEDQKRVEELERIQREREEDAKLHDEEAKRQKQMREERRRQEEERMRQEELQREEEERQEIQRKHEEYERKIEEERQLEAERIAEEKRLKQMEKAKQQEVLKKKKLEDESERKRQKIQERFEKLTPEQKKEFIERRKQRLENKTKKHHANEV